MHRIHEYGVASAAEVLEQIEQSRADCLLFFKGRIGVDPNDLAPCCVRTRAGFWRCFAARRYRRIFGTTTGFTNTTPSRRGWNGCGRLPPSAAWPL